MIDAAAAEPVEQRRLGLFRLREERVADEPPFVTLRFKGGRRPQIGGVGENDEEFRGAPIGSPIQYPLSDLARRGRLDVLLCPSRLIAGRNRRTDRKRRHASEELNCLAPPRHSRYSIAITAARSSVMCTALIDVHTAAETGIGKGWRRQRGGGVRFAQSGPQLDDVNGLHCRHRRGECRIGEAECAQSMGGPNRVDSRAQLGDVNGLNRSDLSDKWTVRERDRARGTAITTNRNAIDSHTSHAGGGDGRSVAARHFNATFCPLAAGGRAIVDVMYAGAAG